jgi:hypothetical protein
MRQIIIVAISSVMLFPACRQIFAKRINGNGNIITQTRSAGQFNSIDVGGSIDVYVKQDSVRSIKVEADENLQQYIETINDGDLLRIKTEEGFNINSSRKIKVYVSGPMFKSLDVSGACDLFGDGNIKSSSAIDIGLSGSCHATLDIDAPKVSADLSGSCSVNLKGQTKDFDIKGSGSMELKCFDLLAENVDLDISGAGDAEVYSSVKLSGSISGSADVRYKGAAQTSIETSGSSSIKKAD